MNFAELLRKNLRFVIVLPLLVAAVVLVVSLLKQPLYKSSASLLVVQKQTDEIDANIAVKSAEQMADILSRVVDSDTFRSAVLTSSHIKVSLSPEPWKKAKQWRKIVKTRNITDTGILVIDVYQPTSSQATNLALAVEKVLITEAHDYLGVNQESVVIRELNPPAPSHSRPATPNLFLNGFVGLLFGLIVAVSLILFFPNTSWSKIITLPFRITRSKKITYSAGYGFNDDENITSGMIYSGQPVEEEMEQSHIAHTWPQVEQPLASTQDLVTRASEHMKKIV